MIIASDGGRDGRDRRTGGVISYSPSATQAYRQLEEFSGESGVDRFICSRRSLLN